MESAAGGLESLLLPILLFAVLYLLLLRPQAKRRKEQARLTASLASGDEVVTIGGLHGIVHATHEATVDLTVTFAEDGVTPDVIVRFDRSAIARRLPANDGEPGADGDQAGEGRDGA